MRSYFSLLARRPGFRRLWAAELVSLFGDWFSVVAVSVLALSSSGGGFSALAATLAAHLLPQAAAAPLGGWVADRFDRRAVLVIGALLEAALTVGMVIAATSANLGGVQVLLACRAIVSSVRDLRRVLRCRASSRRASSRPPTPGWRSRGARASRSAWRRVGSP
ncbi:MAG: MFS transporter [Polyangiaceae bacterium]